VLKVACEVEIAVSTQLITQIMTGLRYRYAALNEIRYDAGWTDSWVYCRCFHGHETLTQAAECGMAHPGFYVVAVESGEPRELTTAENDVVNRVRFGTDKPTF
jgi:hypothetical protein